MIERQFDTTQRPGARIAIGDGFEAMGSDLQDDPTVTPRAPAQMRPPRMDALAVLPVFFKLGGKRAVLAGGGEPAAWKAELLSAAGASVDVYAPEVSLEMRAVADAPPVGTITVHERRWAAEDLAGAAIAIGAITDDAEGAAFFEAARAAGVPVNIVDRPELCEFQFGSIVNRSPLVVAISTDGAAPVFGQAIRSRIEALLPQGFKRWAEAARRWRREGERLGRTIAERRRFWELFTERALNDSAKSPLTRSAMRSSHKPMPRAPTTYRVGLYRLWAQGRAIRSC